MSVACLGKCYAVWGHDEIGDTIRLMPACPMPVLLSLANRVPLFHVSERCLYHSSIIFFCFDKRHFFAPFSEQNIQVSKRTRSTTQQHGKVQRTQINLFFYFVLFLRKCVFFFFMSVYQLNLLLLLKYFLCDYQRCWCSECPCRLGLLKLHIKALRVFFLIIVII